MAADVRDPVPRDAIPARMQTVVVYIKYSVGEGHRVVHTRADDLQWTMPPGTGIGLWQRVTAPVRVQVRARLTTKSKEIHALCKNQARRKRKAPLLEGEKETEKEQKDMGNLQCDSRNSSTGRGHGNWNTVENAPGTAWWEGARTEKKRGGGDWLHSAVRAFPGFAGKGTVGVVDMQTMSPVHIRAVQHHETIGTRTWAVHTQDPRDGGTHFVAHLAGLHPRLFLTSATGAIAALRALRSHIVGVCDKATAREVQMLATEAPALTTAYSCTSGKQPLETATEVEQLKSPPGISPPEASLYTECLVELDSECMTAEEFYLQFYPAAVLVARRLSSDTQIPVIVHCALGVNRSCTAVLMACALLAADSRAPFHMGQAIDYVREINLRLRCCAVLTNRTFARLLACFGEWLRDAGRAPAVPENGARDFADFVDDADSNRQTAPRFRLAGPAAVRDPTLAALITRLRQRPANYADSAAADTVEQARRWADAKLCL